MRELLLPLARTLVSSPFQMTDFRCLMWGKIPCCSELWCHPSRRQAPKRNRNFASCIMPKQTSEPSSGSQCPFPPPQPRARHVLDQSEMDARSTGAHPAEISYVCSIARLALLCLGQPVRGGAETHTRQIRSAVLGQTHYRALIYAHRTHPLLSSQPLWCDPFLFAYIPTQVLRLFRDSCAERCQFGAERPSRQESHETALQLCLICLCQSLGQAEATGREGLTVGWNRFPFPARLRPV